MPDVAAAWNFLEDSDLVASAQEVEVAIARLAQEISEKLREAYPVVLTVMGGAVVFAGPAPPALALSAGF
jgi:hypoxanthine phosphoribosyltransferase